MSDTAPQAERAHHRYGTSKFQYLDACAAFESQSGTNAAAEEGTFFHTIMDEGIELVKKGKYPTLLGAVCFLTMSSRYLDEKDADLLKFCAIKVDEYLIRKIGGKGPRILNEVKVSILRPDKSQLNHGYLDLLLAWPGMAVLIDYKFGWQPVTPAKENLQGMGYSLAVLQAAHNVTKIGVVFLQPKLHSVTEHVWNRSQLPDMYQRLSDVISRAEFVRANPDQALKYMSAGYWCEYCKHQGICATRANYAGVVAKSYGSLPVPRTFDAAQLTDPQDIALARYWCDCVESFCAGIKEHAKKKAEELGGSLSVTLPDGSVITYGIETKKTDRVLGNTAEVAEALKDLSLTPEQVLAASSINLGALETLVKDTATMAAKAEGKKLTKKAAWEQACIYLESLGLLTRPEGEIKYLKLQKHQKQITQ